MRDIKLYNYLFLIMITFLSISSFIDNSIIKYIYILKFITIFLFIVLNLNKINIQIIKKNSSMLILIYIYILISGSTLCISDNLSIKDIFIYISFIIFFVLTMYIFPFVNKDTNDFLKILESVFIGCLLGIFYALVNTYLFNGSVYYINLSDNRARYIFSFINPNFLGMFCLLGSLCGIGLLIVGGKTFSIRKKVILLSLIFILLCFIIISDSRTSIFSFILWVLLYSFLKYVNIHFIKLAIIYTTISSSVIFIIFNYYSDKINNILSNRLEFWMAVIEKSKFNWELLFGWGFGVMPEDFNVGTFDNSYIYLIAINGLIGLVLLLVVYFIPLLKLKNFKSKNQILFVLVTSVIWLVYCIFESALISIGNIFSIFIWGCLISTTTSKVKNLKRHNK